MKKLLVLPTWSVVYMLKPFLHSGHLLKKKITLQNWYDNSTDLNRAFSIYFWFIPFILALVIYNLNK